MSRQTLSQAPVAPPVAASPNATRSPLAWALVCLLVVLGCIVPRTALAGTFTIDDKAELLTADEAARLEDSVAGLAQYADAAFVTTSTNSSSTEQFAHTYVNGHFGSGPAVIFVIDMANREIYVYANQEALKTLSRADSRAIADNVYRLASAGDYLGCATKAFDQIRVKFEGGRIARPVKHITNLLIALVLGTLVNFFAALSSRAGTTVGKRRKATNARTMLFPTVLVGRPNVTRSIRRHIHTSSSAGRGFGGGGGGGFGGGGGGGGGGHKF